MSSQDASLVTTTEASHSMPNYVTVVVLIVGTFGGLGVVILVILFCKHCIKRNNLGEREDKEKQYGLSSLSSHAERLLSGYQEATLKESHNPQTAGWLMESKPGILKRPSTSADYVPRISQDMSVEAQNFCGSPQPSNREIGGERPDQVPSRQPSDLLRGGIHDSSIDLYDKLYPERHLTPGKKDGVHSKYIDRESYLASVRSVRSLSSGRSRSTLQSSMDSTDNRSEITVIEVSQQGERQASQQHSVGENSLNPSSPSLGRAHHRSAFAPVPARRQSTKTETGNKTFLPLSRQVRSHDEGMMYDHINCTMESDDRLNKARVRWNNREHNVITPSLSISSGNPEADALDSTDKHCTDSSSDQEQMAQAELISCENTGDEAATTSDGEEGSCRQTESCRLIWNLRSTYEQDDDISDPTAAEVDADLSPHDEFCIDDGRLPPNVICSSFDSDNSTANLKYLQSDHSVAATEGASTHLLHPPEHYASRRQKFQNILANRARRRLLDPMSSTELSFDSFETNTTEGGDTSSSSRFDIYTTSFESSTTTDSTSESREKRQHMLNAKHDSGYKSIETPVGTSAAAAAAAVPGACIAAPSCSTLPPAAIPKKISFALDEGDEKKIFNYKSADRPSRTASKKRRDYHSYSVRHVNNSSIEIETDSKDDSTLPSGDSFDESAIPNMSGKYSVFFRFFHSNASRQKKGISVTKRDYSIDEQTDSVFREFMRYDPSFDSHSRVKARTRVNTRLNRCSYTDPSSLDDLPIPDDWTEGEQDQNPIPLIKLPTNSDSSGAEQISTS